MFCRNCGNELNDGATFCSECGTKIYDIEEANINKTDNIIVKKAIIIFLAIAIIFSGCSIVIFTAHKNNFDLNDARNRFQEAQEVYKKWYLSPEYDKSVSIKENGMDCYLVVGTKNTKSKIKKELHKYLSNDICNRLLENRYVEHNGDLYYIYPIIGFETQLKKTGDKLIKSKGS